MQLAFRGNPEGARGVVVIAQDCEACKVRVAGAEVVAFVTGEGGGVGAVGYVGRVVGFEGHGWCGGSSGVCLKGVLGGITLSCWLGLMRTERKAWNWCVVGYSASLLACVGKKAER